MTKNLFGGIELGGTKAICVLTDSTGVIHAQKIIPTTSVSDTFTAIYNFFEQNDPFHALGVGAFGPVQLNPLLAEFGSIYNSPKLGWTKVPVLELLKERFKVPIAIDTDVACAALGEYYYGAAKNVDTLVYMTIGTGIGGSSLRDGVPQHGILHPEMGHMRVPHEPFTDSFKGACVYHGDCLEGIASGHAMEARYGKSAQEITDAAAWDNEADYIAAAVSNLLFSIGPERVVLGGGLMQRAGLIEAIRTHVKNNVNGYMAFPDPMQYIVQASSELNGALGASRLLLQ